MANALLAQLKKEARMTAYGQVLPYRVRRFVTLFDGTNYAMLAKLLRVTVDTLKRWEKDPRVVLAIRTRDDIHDCVEIADRITRQEFWSGTMLDENEDMKHRLKASELLGRSECDFSETRIIKGVGSAVNIFVNTGVPRSPDDPVAEPAEMVAEEVEAIPVTAEDIW